MTREMTRRRRKASDGGLMISLSGMLLLGLVGCANKQLPPPAPPVTPDQVRTHADKSFEKLKQEERDRAEDPAATSY